MIAGKLALGLVLLLIIFRLLGRKTLDQITPIDFITTVIMADLLVEMSVDDTLKVWEVLSIITIWALITFALDTLKYKNKKFRDVTSGQPLVLIRNGVINQDVLKKEMMTQEELAVLLREKGIFYPSEVEVAILEINGKISVKKRSESNG